MNPVDSVFITYCLSPPLTLLPELVPYPHCTHPGRDSGASSLDQYEFQLLFSLPREICASVLPPHKE